MNPVKHNPFGQHSSSSLCEIGDLHNLGSLLLLACTSASGVPRGVSNSVKRVQQPSIVSKVIKKANEVFCCCSRPDTGKFALPTNNVHFDQSPIIWGQECEQFGTYSRTDIDFHGTFLISLTRDVARWKFSAVARICPPFLPVSADGH